MSDEPMRYDTIRVERDATAHIATVTLHRPAVLNALDGQLTAELRAGLREIGAQFPAIRAIVLTGAGRGFCSGADMSLMARRLLEGGDDAVPGADPAGEDSIVMLAADVQRLPQPVIAAVNGIAAGGGLGLACACDIRIASEQARFAALFVKRALVPDTAASGTLPRLVGHGVASEMALTGRIYDAAWALRVGLVNDVVPAERLLETATAMAREIAANPPLTVRSTKQLLGRDDLAAVVREEIRANAPSTGSEDRREAIRAYVEKREPRFRGR